MDRFVQRQKSGRNVTAHHRHSEFKQWTHVSGDKLFCTVCNVVINHERKSLVEKHRDSAKHQTKSKGEPPAKHQKTITSCDGVTSTSSAPNTISSEARNELCKELVAVFAASNIPLSKLDHPQLQFRNFLHKHVVNGGAVPKSKQLQECFLQRELVDKKDLVQKAIEDKPVAVICDEMSDDIGRFVINILVSPMEPDSDGKIKSYLLDTVFLPKTDHAEVSGAVITTLVNWKVKFQDVITFNTDNAAYMKRAFGEVIKCVMPNCSHVTCLAHIMNLLGDSFRKPFQQANKYIKSANAILWHAAARKARYIRYLKESDPE